MLVCQRIAFRFWAVGWKMAVCWALPAKVETVLAFALPSSAHHCARVTVKSKILPTIKFFLISAGNCVNIPHHGKAILPKLFCIRPPVNGVFLHHSFR